MVTGDILRRSATILQNAPHLKWKPDIIGVTPKYLEKL
jgi:hypothetical protein